MITKFKFLKQLEIFIYLFTEKYIYIYIIETRYTLIETIVFEVNIQENYLHMFIPHSPKGFILFGIFQ